MHDRKVEMMARVRTLLSVCLILFMTLPGNALGRSLSIATWNTENLSEIAGKSLFEGRSYSRTERDYTAMLKYLLHLNADILLFQEIASPQALETILPEGYKYYFSPQHLSSRRSEAGIFTAIAFRADAITLLDTVSIQTSEQSIGQSGSSEFTRDSIGIKIQTPRGILWIINVHLKSSCDNKYLPRKPGGTSSCAALQRQLRMLSVEIQKLRSEGADVILGGDFNRRGIPTYEQDPYLRILFPTDVESSTMFVRPKSRQCPTFKGLNRLPIDYFMIFSRSMPEVLVDETLFHPKDLRQGYKLSDHCPVRMLIIYP